MDDEPTCGKGLAAHSTLPAKMADLTEAVAGVLENHMGALDLSDENSKREHGAYGSLASAHRQAAARLRSTATEMAGYQSLPMGKHDMEKMMAPEAATAFSRLVRLEEELLALLQARVTEHRAMLGEMGAQQ